MRPADAQHSYRLAVKIFQVGSAFGIPSPVIAVHKLTIFPFQEGRLNMNRRDWLKNCACAAGGASLVIGGGRCGASRAWAADPPDERGTPPLKITDIKTILTAPANIRLVVVKVLTSEIGRAHV